MAQFGVGDLLNAGKALKEELDKSKGAKPDAGAAPTKFAPTTLEDGTQAQSAKQGGVTAVVSNDGNNVIVFRDKDGDGVNDVKVKASRNPTTQAESLEYTNMNTGKVTTTPNSPLAGALLDGGFAIDKKFEVREASQAGHLVDVATPPAPAPTPAAATPTTPRNTGGRRP